MKNLTKQRLKSEKGFTMIELIIVVAIIGILSAILVPSFANMTRNSRLKSDLSTIRQAQTQIDLYVAEHDGDFPGTTPAGTSALTISEAFAKLAADGYIKPSDVDGADLKLQTKGATVSYTTGDDHIKLNVTGANDTKVPAAAGKLSDSDKSWIVGYTTP